jgi:uncharacterized repeat protein (TIGR03803 family)
MALGVALMSMSSVANAAVHRVLYAFRAGSDGAYPLAGLTILGATLYGTTTGGGSFGEGTVFALTSGAETVLHAFAGGSDGSTPNAGLTNLGGTLFGTTYLGGGSSGCPNGCGTVFSVSPTSGAETVVYAFKGFLNNDGAYPFAGLIALGGDLYGTTSAGGGGMSGGAFSIAPTAGAEIVFQSISGYAGDNPEAALVDVGGTLYGTAFSGGNSAKCDNGGCGTVFSWNPDAGAPAALHQFQDSPDGLNPEASMIYLNGSLIGTTFAGGAYGKGSVFAVDLLTGAERVLYSFKGSSDGAYPAANLINLAGTLYGTTSQGGESATCAAAGGCGTVFSIATKSRAEQVVYAFGGGRDGATPEGGLAAEGGTLYGTTAYGGNADKCSNGGCGTVFSFTP